MVSTRVVLNPKTMLGKPVIRGTRIPVEIILRKLAQNLSPKEILEDYPQLTEEDIKAAVDYGASSVQNEETYPISEDR